MKFTPSSAEESSQSRNGELPAAKHGESMAEKREEATSAHPRKRLPELLPAIYKVEERDLKIGLWLLLIICLVCLGVLPLAPQLVFTTTPISHSHPAAITPHPTAFEDGQCTTPQQIQYLPASQTHSGTPQLPPQWHQLKLADSDFAYAQACAAAFVDIYNTFDIQKVSTLEASVTLLSSAGRQRFFGEIAPGKADPRLSPSWRASAQKQQLRQQAQASMPSLLNAQSYQGDILAWMAVPYKISIQRNGKTTTHIRYATILLVQKNPDPQGRNLNWQVSDWKDGTTVFTAPNVI